ncbi:hypothetical protein CU254_00470 [Amycolatopsis sp. AA4]|uniref:hypothetical protein n=1 Tax=Actinomycetes TaxID=1760 RepID=UPI0001B55A1F|nr:MULTISPECIES: hypothetical protein [Actinomycetes]ATY09126.1 hypothetical protein CU254_00470 [Amycolatopsis sp. AA4]EFL04421.1 predicted protein [Streptomyces sp. AA4]
MAETSGTLVASENFGPTAQGPTTMRRALMKSPTKSSPAKPRTVYAEYDPIAGVCSQDLVEEPGNATESGTIGWPAVVLSPDADRLPRSGG